MQCCRNHDCQLFISNEIMNKEKPLFDKIIQHIKNMWFFVILFIVVLSFIKLSDFKDAYENLFPNHEESYCQGQLKELNEIEGNISNLLYPKDIDYGKILKLKRDLEVLIRFEKGI